VGRNPLQVEIDHRPKDVLNPCAIFLFRLDQPLGEFEQDVDAEGWTIYPLRWETRKKKKKHAQHKKSHTRGRGTDASLRIEKLVELDIEYGLPNATGVYIPGEADHLHGSRESVDHIVYLGPQTRVIEYGELIDPRVVDEAGIAKPVNRELRMVGIWDDGCNNADLEVERQVRINVNTTKAFQEHRTGGRLDSHQRRLPDQWCHEEESSL
jgi:hypothetical protein